MSHKTFRKNIVTTIFAATLFTIGNAQAWAATFSGNICYSGHFTERETGPVDETYNFTLHVKPLDTTTCAAHALVAVAKDNPAFMSGVCRIATNFIYLNLAETQAHKDGWMDSEIMQIKLDKTTLNGTIYHVSHDFNTTTRTSTEGYASGTLTKIACP